MFQVRIRKNQQVVNFISNLVAFAVDSGLAFFLTPFIVARVGSEAYGFIPIAFLMITYVTIFTSALNSMADRFISIEVNSNNTEKANLYFNSVFMANILISLLLIAPFIVVIVYLDRIFNIPAGMEGDVRITFGFVFVSIITALIGGVFGTAVFCKNRLDLSSFRNVTGNMTKLALTVLLFALFPPRIYFITLIAAVIMLYSVLMNVYYTVKLLPEIKISPKFYDKPAVKTLVGSGAWNSLNELSAVLLSGLDLVIANVFFGSYLAGQYSLAKIIPAFAITFIVNIVAIFAPQFTILYAQNKRRELFGNITLSMKIVGMLAAIPTAFLFVFGDVFFRLWQPSVDARAIFILSNLILIPIMITGSMQPIFSVYTVANRLKIPALVLLLSGVLNISLTVILFYVTPLGIYSLPVSSMSVNILRTFAFNLPYGAHCLKLNKTAFYLVVLKGMACAALVMAISYAWKNSIAVDSWLMLGVSAAVCGVISLFLCALVMFNKNETRQFLRLLAFRKNKKNKV